MRHGTVLTGLGTLMLLGCGGSRADDSPMPFNFRLPGTYVWYDDVIGATGCVVRLYESNGRIQGFIEPDFEESRTCQFTEFRISDADVQGGRVRLDFRCGDCIGAAFGTDIRFSLEPEDPNVMRGRFIAGRSQAAGRSRTVSLRRRS